MYYNNIDEHSMVFYVATLLCDVSIFVKIT